MRNKKITMVIFLLKINSKNTNERRLRLSNTTLDYNFNMYFWGYFLSLELSTGNDLTTSTHSYIL